MTRIRRALQRLPIRVKLALISTGVMTLVMVGVGLFLYFRFEDELDTSIDQALSARAVAASVLSGRGERARMRAELSREEGFGELVAPDGRVITSTPDVHGRMLIPPAQLAQARRRTTYFELKHLEDISKHARLIARPVRTGGPIVVVGTTLKDRERANESLVRTLLIGVPLAMLLASIAGVGVAAGALRPVERMRSRAATISAGEADARLPLPEARDEIRRLGETLNEMLARLQSAFQRERSFVADASHELRTPLAILKAELELAGRGERTNAELGEALRSAREEVDRLSRLAEDLLVLARADDGRLPVRAEAQPLAPLVREVATAFEAQANSDGRAITIESPPGLEAPVDALRIRQALGNLVENALRHGEGDVRVYALQTNGDVELHVADEGHGFPEEFLPHAFERFARGDAARARGGSGLGLAIVEAIARGHGGSVHARNTDGGSDVWLVVPAQSKSTDAAPDPIAVPSA